MRKILSFSLILGVLFLFATTTSNAQVHKVKISEINEKIADESPQSGKQTEYQLPSVNNPLITNSPGTLVGNTYYEYQHNGTMARMIALDSLGGIHFNWMNLVGPEIAEDRYVYYNYLDPAGYWLAPGGVPVTPPIARGGYTGIAGILPDGREVLCFHQPMPWQQAPWFTTLAIEKTYGGFGEFYRYDLPDSIPGVGTREYWPKAVLDSLNSIHVVMSQALSGAIRPQALGYTRCRLEDDTLICEAPGIDTVRIPPNTRISDPLKNRCAFFDSSGTISQIVVTSPVSKKVAIIYTKYTNPNKSPSFGDVYYIESTNGGQDWIDAGGFASIEKHNITHYTINDTLRAYFDLAAVYDYNDNLHILWTTPGYWEAQDSATTDACFLWHWSQATGISLVANGWKPSRPGAFNRTISKMSIGVNPTNNYLYAIWTQFDISDTAANGYSNGEIYASASKDNGFTWDGPKDLTVTPTPGCQAGQCESDHWASLAEIVNDTLHIQYINDKDAGAAIQLEGAYTYNPVLYLKVPAWEPEIFRVNFSGSPKAGFKPFTVQFADSSIGNIISRLWDFGGGITDTSKNPVHIYNYTGYYTVKLTLSSPGSSYTILKANYIAVFDTLKVDFTAEPTYGRKPLTVSFNSIFNETPESITWNFGDGQSSHEPNPVHIFTEFGKYDVKLVAELCGYKDSVVKEEYIQAVGIRTEFSASKRCGPNPLTVTFTDSSTGTNPIVAWHWDFGDGDTSGQRNPTHQFQSEGAFDITLIASDGIVAETLAKNDYIIVQDSLKADFAGTPDSGRSPLNVSFDPILTGVANQYFWDFGDGGTSNSKSPIHSYTNQGKYEVKLIAKLELDDCHYADTVSKEDYVIVNDLKADFHADVTMGLKPLSVHFYDASSGNPDSWHWNFGDGNTSIEKNPQHQYDSEGFYDVSLRVTNFLGVDSILKSGYIRVGYSLGNEYSLEPVNLQTCSEGGIVQVNINIKTVDSVAAFVVCLYAEGTANPVLDTMLTGGLSYADPPAFYPPSLVSGFEVRVVRPYYPPADSNMLLFAAVKFWPEWGLIPPTNGLFCRMFYKVSGPGTLNFRTGVDALGNKTSMWHYQRGEVPINWPEVGDVGMFNVTVSDGVIAGTKFRDVNRNGIRDPGEPGLPGWMLTLDPLGFAALTDSSGNYYFSCLPARTYTISEVVKRNWQQTCPALPGTYTVVLNQGQTVTGKDFGNMAPDIQDLSVNVGGGTARPGFQKLYGIQYENRGTIATNGTVILSLPSQVSYLESSPGGMYNSGSHTVTWDVGLLPPDFIGSLWAKVQIPNTVPIGDTLTSNAHIEPTAGDSNPADNYDIESQTVRGAYDPNEMLVTPLNDVLAADTLRYQINFQNVGNDTAFNIVIRDTLESNLDITTLESGASSHPYVFQISGRELTWKFANINLPDSIVNQPGSQGFVTFKVRPRSDIAIGTDIENRAAVYFDFNQPVITNTVHNTIKVFRGDANGDGKRTVADVVYLINYLFKGGPLPVPILQVGDVNCDSKVTVADVVYLINYLFKGGPPPC